MRPGKCPSATDAGPWRWSIAVWNGFQLGLIARLWQDEKNLLLAWNSTIAADPLPAGTVILFGFPAVALFLRSLTLERIIAPADRHGEVVSIRWNKDADTNRRWEHASAGGGAVR